MSETTPDHCIGFSAAEATRIDDLLHGISRLWPAVSNILDTVRDDVRNNTWMKNFAFINYDLSKIIRQHPNISNMTNRVRQRLRDKRVAILAQNVSAEASPHLNPDITSSSTNPESPSEV